MLGWHFVSDNKKLRYGDGRKIKVGKTYTVEQDCELELCTYGLHASKRLIDALKYAPGAVICRVELNGKVEKGDDKACAYSRRVIAMIDGTKLLHEFACRAAEYALTFVKNTDPRSVATIKAKRDWLAGKISDQELSAARAAAWAAAGFAAWSAAWAAAGDAARDALNKILTEMVKSEIRKQEEK